MVSGPATCRWNALSLSSSFQPIVGVAEQRVIGYEGLVRANDVSGRRVTPPMVFEAAVEESEKLYLDWLLRALHMRNLRTLGDNSGLLFINVSPNAAIHDPRFAEVFTSLIAHFGLAPKNIVVEITENAATHEVRLVDAVNLYKTIGCSVAIDDFGAGASDVRRVWRLRPDIVKLDRSLMVAAAEDDHALRVLKNIVNMMHDCGARVVLEGVEERHEALAALETNADFLQGYFFGKPETNRLPDEKAKHRLAELVPKSQMDCLESTASPSQQLKDWDPHCEALIAASMAIETGASFSEAVQLLQSLPGTECCRLLSADGELLSANFDHHGRDKPANRANRAIGPSIYRTGAQARRLANVALNDPGRVKFTMPYRLTSAFDSARHGVTFCLGFSHGAQIVAVCVDVII